MTTNLGNDNCPACKTIINRSTAIGEDSIPVPGDLSICINCGEYLYFEDDMKLGVYPKILFDILDKETKLKLQKARKYIRCKN